MTHPDSSSKPSSRDRVRLTLIAVALFTLFGTLVIKFYQIQIAEGKLWSQRAKRQHEMVITEPFLRGTFYGNVSVKKEHPEHPQPLVVDVPKYHLYVDPKSIPEELREEIAEFLAMKTDRLITDPGRFHSEFKKDSRSRRLAMWLDPADRDEIYSWWRPYARKHRIARNAIYFESDYKRSYPFGSMLGQVLHTIRGHKNEETREGLPTGGLELFFNDYLKGKQGKRVLLRSPGSSLETGRVIEHPVHGADVYLTINPTLQAIVEEELEKGATRYRASSGWAVMMDPFSGEILALAQFPFFDPSRYREFYNDASRIEDTKVRAVTDAYEPGSTVKPLTLAIALLANKALEERGEGPLFSPDEKITTSDGRFPGRTRPLKDTKLHPYLNMRLALQKSSNIYMAELVKRMVDRLGNEWYRTALKEVFGFGKETSIELPSETSGVLPTPGKLHPNGTLEWSLPTPYSLAIGHNMQVNSIQMVRAYAILANGGRLVKPTLIKKIVRRNAIGEEEAVVGDFGSQELARARQTLPSSVVKEVVRALKYVTKPGGGARRANIPGFTEAGKTGTSRKIVGGKYSTAKYLSTFVGIAPLSKPRFVLLIALDEPMTTWIPGIGSAYYGSISAAPLFRNIAKRALEFLGETPDDPFGYAPGDPRYDPALADWNQEDELLQKLYRQWNAKS